MGKENLISEKANNPWTKVPTNKKETENARTKAGAKSAGHSREKTGIEKKTRNPAADINEDAYLD